MGLWDFIAFFLFPLWSIFVIITATLNAGNTWSLTDQRLAEAHAGSIGVETPLSPSKAIKVVTLCFISAIGVSIAGYGLATDAVAMISMFDEYHDKTNSEADDKNDSSNDDAPGTAATSMIVHHMVTTLYGHFQLGVIALLAYTFRWYFTTYDDEFTCDLQEDTVSINTYQALISGFSSMTDRASCYAKIDQMFDIEDINGDGVITRCEDAILQRAFGASKEYAFKYSDTFDRAKFKKICEENFAH